MHLLRWLSRCRDGLRSRVGLPVNAPWPEAEAEAGCTAVRGMHALDRELMAQLCRAVGLSEQSALSLVERVGGLRQRSAGLVRYLEQAGAQSEAMQDGIELNGRIIHELAAFVQTLPRQIAQERTQFQQLLAEVSKLTEMTDTVSGIARQTEILAINAAIEAARAGEAGKGFAVLAGEMRRLATQSNASATQAKQDIDALMQTIELSCSGEFEERTRHNESEAERLGKLTLKLDESYVDMRQFYKMLMTAVTQHHAELDVGIGLLLDSAQTQDVFKQIVDRVQPALDARHAVLAELIGRLRAGLRDTGAIDAKALALAPSYLALEAEHRDPDAAASAVPGQPAARIELF
jgi:methyl-accepting chemotaxis protein